MGRNSPRWLRITAAVWLLAAAGWLLAPRPIDPHTVLAAAEKVRPGMTQDEAVAAIEKAVRTITLDSYYYKGKSSVGLHNGSRINGEVGQLRALVDEIEFNVAVLAHVGRGNDGASCREEQFRRAIRTGSISLLASKLKSAIIDAYGLVSQVNTLTMAAAESRYPMSPHLSGTIAGGTFPQADEAKELLRHAHQKLLQHLSQET